MWHSRAVFCLVICAAVLLPSESTTLVACGYCHSERQRLALWPIAAHLTALAKGSAVAVIYGGRCVDSFLDRQSAQPFYKIATLAPSAASGVKTLASQADRGSPSRNRRQQSFGQPTDAVTHKACSASSQRRSRSPPPRHQKEAGPTLICLWSSPAAPATRRSIARR